MAKEMFIEATSWLNVNRQETELTWGLCLLVYACVGRDLFALKPLPSPQSADLRSDCNDQAHAG